MHNRGIVGRTTALALLLALAAAAPPAAALPPGLPSPPWLQQAESMLADTPDAALELADHAVAATQRLGDRRAAYTAHLARGLLQRRLGRYGEAVLDYERALSDAEALAEPQLVAEARHALGVAFSLSGMHPDAMQALQRAYALQSERGDWGRASAALTNIGNLLSDSGDAAGAREHYERALAMKREHGIEQGIGILLNNLGDLDREAGRLDEARALLLEAIERHQRLGEAHNESIARSNLGLVLAELGEFQAALHQFEVAEQRTAGSDVRLTSFALAGRAEAYLRMARSEGAATPLRSQRLQRALDAIERAGTFGERIDDPQRRAQIERLGSEIQAELGDPSAALQRLREADRLSREHGRRADADRQAMLAARFRDAQQRREIAELRERELLQRSELQQQRGLALLLGISALALAAVASLLLRQVRQRRRHAGELSARNIALGDALLEAEEQRERAGQLAELNRRLLTLAGNDLRGPLLQIRSLSERLLVERRGDPGLERQVAAIAGSASELMRVADQVTESAALVEGSDRRVAGCNVLALLRELVDQTEARLLGREQRLRLAGDSRAIVRVEPRRLDRVLHELVDAVLQANPGSTPLALDLSRHGEWVELRIDDRSGHLMGRIGGGGGSVGLAFARGVIRELGGELLTEAQGGTPRVLVRLPAA